jgi:hypothetical protein
MIGCATYPGRPIGDEKTVVLAQISKRQTFGLSVPWASGSGLLSARQACRPISDQAFRIADIPGRSRNFGRSVTIDWAYQWRYFGQSVTKPSAYQWPFYRPISDLPPKNLSQNRGLGHSFSTLTRARDLNLELTILTSPKTPPLRGLRPLPAQTQPTRHTPIRNALRATQTSPTHRAPPLAAENEPYHGSAAR